MATEEQLPPACAFAVSVLAERDQDPEAVPEEAVEAAEQHMATCPRCVASRTPQVPAESTRRKKKKVRSGLEGRNETRSTTQTLLEERPLAAEIGEQARGSLADSSSPPGKNNVQALAVSTRSAMNVLDCQSCRQFLPEYAAALNHGQPVALLYPEVHEHLLHCDMGCLDALDLIGQDSRKSRKDKHRPVGDPFSAIGWELSGFFRGGQVSMSPRALAYGTLMLLLLVASLGTFLGFRWNEQRYHTSPGNIQPTPDGVGLSDGLKIFDACNAVAYQAKRDAAQHLSQITSSETDSLLTTALRASRSDSSGCNAGEAAIYQEDLHVRRSGHPFSVVVVNFDSMAGDANPTGGSDRHMLYAAGTQELVGAAITQRQYNTLQMQTPGAPLLYLVLANTTGTPSGANQVANAIASLAQDNNYRQFGLLIDDTHPLLAMLGAGSATLVQDTLPIMCRAGVPVIAPTTSVASLSERLQQISLYNHCAPGFAFARLAADDRQRGSLSANFAYAKLKARNAAILYNPGSSFSEMLAQSFGDNFTRNADAHVVARETVPAGTVIASNTGQAQRVSESIGLALDDGLKARPRPDVLFASMQAGDAYMLAQAIARLPQNQQPALIIDGELIQPKALQGLAQWTHQNQLVQPHVSLSVAAAAQPRAIDAWQKQFYASFCTEFTPSDSACSSPGALDQGALLFADGLESIAGSLGSIPDMTHLPSREQLVQKIKAAHFTGVSGAVAFHGATPLLLTNARATPVLLNIQDDGSLQTVSGL